MEKRPQRRGDGMVAAWMSWHSEDVGDGVPAPVELPVADSAPVDRLGFGQWGGGGCGEPRVLFRHYVRNFNSGEQRSVKVAGIAPIILIT